MISPWINRTSPPKDSIFSDIPDKPEDDYGLPQQIWRRLYGRYGKAAETLVEMAAPADISTIPGTDTLWAELPFVAKTEQIRHLDDLLLRRVRIGLLTPYGGKAYLNRVRKLCRNVLPWDKRRWRKEVKNYLDLWIQSHALPVQRARIQAERKIFSLKAISAFLKYLYYKIRSTKSQHSV